MLQSEGLGKYRKKPPAWYWVIVVILFLSIIICSSWSSSNERSQEAPHGVFFDARLVRAIEGLEKASRRQARALEDISKELKKRKCK